MQNIFTLSFWSGWRTWLLLFSLCSALLWIGAYISFKFSNGGICELDDQACLNLWLETLGAPFYGGYLLKSMILAPLLILFSTKTAFKVWVVMSFIVIPYALYDVLFVTPISGPYFSKLSMNDVFGMAYLAFTVLIVVLVPLGTYLRRYLFAR